ncbi:tRNA (adenosine(37)-N6)-dimethylallyltransferase MiaA [bacterium]|nr:MAG: tRNA (adenosine(37)-N6)-dimethylallyltransferase MiaA [bacterium]
MEKIKIAVICGPTASGKSALALELAPVFNAEIISADSMQVYKGMDIGTAKPSQEERRKAVHHLIDIAEPDENYTAARFKADAARKIAEISSRGKNIFVVGGTGLYIKALTKGMFDGPEGDAGLREELLREAELYGSSAVHAKLKDVDPESAAVIHPNNLQRVVRALEVYCLSKTPMSELKRAHAFSQSPYNALKIGLVRERALLYASIEKRVDAMLSAGLLDEVKGLLGKGYSPSLKPMAGLGYKEMCAHISGNVSYGEAIRLLKRNTRHYAKRQLTWFGKDTEIRWFSLENKDMVIRLIREHLG